MSEEEDFIPTKGSMRTKPKQDFQIVTFQSRKPLKSRNKPENRQSPESIPKNDINMKRTRFEVIKFGMSGFDPQKKEEAKVQLAIKLGAKPPRNKYKNYKKLIEERKAERDAERARLDFQQLGKNKLGKSNAKGKSYDKKRRKDRGGLLDIYGKVKIPLVTNSRKKKT